MLSTCSKLVRVVIQPLSALNLTLIAIVFMAMALPAGTGEARGPRRPDYPPLVGNPTALSIYWHDQRWQESDYYACALYAQAAVLEAFGFNFRDELAAARTQGQRDGWYDPGLGTIGLGQPLRAHDITFEVYGSPRADYLTPTRSIARLQMEIAAGRYALVTVNAQALGYYQGSPIQYHTLWITGIRLDEDGYPISIIANDSYRGPAVEYPPGEFILAWGAPELNYYAIFIRPPRYVYDRNAITP